MASNKQKQFHQLGLGAMMLATILTHFLGSMIQPSFAATSSSQSSETASPSQPLWSYQVKPNNYGQTGGPPSGHYSAFPSLFDTFSGLSQRQGALSSGSPLMTILPIILIAAGGLLLLLPMFTMMLASPFGGGAFGGYQGGFGGYPQGGLSKRRSLHDGSPIGNLLTGSQQRGIIDLIEHVSTTIDELTKKYSPNGASQTQASNNGQHLHSGNHKRAKSLNANDSQAANQPTNHKASEEPNSVGGILASPSAVNL